MEHSQQYNYVQCRIQTYSTHTMVIISCVDIYCWQKSTKIVNWHASSIIPSENTNWSLDSLTSTKLTVDQYDFFQVIFLSTPATGINDNTVYIKVSRITMFCTHLRYWQCSPLTHREPYCFKFPFWVKIITDFCQHIWAVQHGFWST